MLERDSPLQIILLAELMKDSFNGELLGALLVMCSALIQVSVVSNKLGHDWKESVDILLLSPEGMKVEGEEEVITYLLTYTPAIRHQTILKMIINISFNLL